MYPLPITSPISRSALARSPRNAEKLASDARARIDAGADVEDLRESRIWNARSVSPA